MVKSVSKHVYISGRAQAMSTQDVDTEIGALTYIMRKLWGGSRSLWRNSPSASNDERIQALKSFMRRNDEDSPLHHRADSHAVFSLTYLQVYNQSWEHASFQPCRILKTLMEILNRPLNLWKLLCQKIFLNLI